MAKYTWRPPVELRDGEPWFFLRGQDRYSPHGVAGYAQGLLAAATEADERGDTDRAAELRQLVESVRAAYSSFIEWQEENVDLVKTPD